MRESSESAPPPRPGRPVPQRGDRGVDRTVEASIYAAALRQTSMDQRHAMGEALAQAEALLGELADLGRYARDAAPEDRELDRLRLALALMRARRGGFEDGALLQAWWRDSIGTGLHQATSEDTGGGRGDRDRAW